MKAVGAVLALLGIVVAVFVIQARRANLTVGELIAGPAPFSLATYSSLVVVFVIVPLVLTGEFLYAQRLRTLPKTPSMRRSRAASWPGSLSQAGWRSSCSRPRGFASPTARAATADGFRT